MFDLGKFLRASYAQINPFDGGQDWNSVYAQKKKQVTQPQRQGTPAVRQALQPSAPQMTQQQRQEVQRKTAYLDDAVRKSRNEILSPSRILDDIGRAGADVGKNLVSGIQQAGGNIADIALQGGAVLNDVGAATNPFINDRQKQAARERSYRNTEMLRNQIKQGKTVTGQSLNPNKDFQWTGDTGRDIANLAGRSIQTGLDATMFANPAAFARGTTGKVGARQLINFAGKDMALYGGGQGAATGAQVYGDTGNLGEAIKQGGAAGLIAGSTQGVLDTAGLAARGANRVGDVVVNNNPVAIARTEARSHPKVLAFDDQYNLLKQQFDTTQDPLARRQVSMAMAENRQARLAAQRGVERDMLQGGYMKVPGATPEPIDPFQSLKQEALKYKSAEEFVSNVHKQIENPANGKSFTTLAQEYGLPTQEQKILNDVEALRWSKGGPKTYPDAANQLGVGKEYADITARISKESDARYKNPYGNVGMMNETYGRQSLTDLYNQAHTEAKPVAPPLVKTTPKAPTVQPEVKPKAVRASKKLGEQKRNPLELPLERRATPKVSAASKTPALQVQTEPQLPANRPPVALAQADGGGELMRQASDIGMPVPKKKSQYASKTIPQSEFVGEQVKTQTKKNAPEYTPETERGRYSQTLRSADQMGFDKFENDVQARLQSKHIDSQTVADSQAVAQRLEAKGDDASLRRAADIYDKVSEHLTKSGQTIQAAAIMARRTPEGMKYQALKDLRKAGVEITPEVQRTITAKVEAIAKTKPQTEARAKAIGELAKDIEKKIPTSTASNLVSVWKAGLLSGVKTTQGNIISNATFGALKKASDPVTLAADTAMSFFTKKYSTTGTYKGLLSGAKEGTRKGVDTLKTGIDTRTFNDKYELHKGINFKNKTVQKYVGTPAQKVFDFMGAQDQPFYFAQLKNSLYDLAEADGRTKGLSGSTLRKHMDDMVQNPTDEIMQRATDEANKAVLAYDTVAFKAIQSAKQGIQNSAIPDVWKSTGTAAIDVLAPFTRVPTAFLSRALDFTPVGVGKEALTQIATKKFDQRALSQAIGEGVTGTGVIVLGAALTNSGQISGDYPDDPKEQQRWKAEGIQPNSVKLGDTWYSLNYLGPLGMLMGAGKKFVDAGKEGAGAIESVGTAIGGFGQTLLGQSFLQGLSGFMEAMNDPDRYLKNFVTRQAGSIVPSISNDFANLMDGYKRETNTALDGILSRIPGLRNTLEKSQDVYGNKLEQGAATDLIGVRPSDQKHSVVLDEVSRLHKVDENNTDYQVTPTTVDRYISINGERVKLSDKQRYDLQEKVGQATQNSWSQIIKSNEYKKLSDLDKAAALNRARLDVSKIAQSEFASSNGFGKIELTKRQASLAKNGFNLANYTSVSSQSLAPGLGKSSVDVLTKYDSLDSKGREKWFASENDAEYKYYKAKYENDKANGEISKIEDIKWQYNLKKDKVGSKYSKDTRDLYSMAKYKIADFVSKDKNGKKLADELLAYDKALYDAGVTKYLKFKYGFGTSSGGRRSGGRGGRKSAGFKLPTTSIANTASASTLAELSRLLAGTTAKNTTPKQIGKRAATKKITVRS